MDLGQAWKGIVTGIKSGFWAGQPIPNYKKQSTTMIEAVGEKIEYLAKTVKERGRACAEAKVLMVANEETVLIFINTQRAGRSNIGSCIARNEEECCIVFLEAYYKWLAGKYMEEAEKVRDIDVIDVPDLPEVPSIPGLPDVGWMKYLIPIVVILVIIMVFLVILGYSGLGPAAGSHMMKK